MALLLIVFLAVVAIIVVNVRDNRRWEDADINVEFSEATPYYPDRATITVKFKDGSESVYKTRFGVFFFDAETGDQVDTLSEEKDYLKKAYQAKSNLRSLTW